jgi:hypothetical protein
LLLLVLNKECFHAIYGSILIVRSQLRGSTASDGLWVARIYRMEGQLWKRERKTSSSKPKM